MGTIDSHLPCDNQYMRWRRRPVSNELVATLMQDFFETLPEWARASPTEAARKYAHHLFDNGKQRLVNQKRFAKAAFHVGIGVEPNGFERVVKRATLVSETLLLSHNGAGERQYVGRLPSQTKIRMPDTRMPGLAGMLSTTTKAKLYCYCPDLDYLGQWLLKSEKLLRAGTLWYLPTYSLDETSRSLSDPVSPPADQVDVPGLLDFMQVGQRVVALDNTSPVATAVVRPVIEDLELPFLDGVTMEDFSAITTDEFDSYLAFQSWLRQELLEIGAAVNTVESERALARIGLQIKDEVRNLESQMRAVRRRRAVAVSGAAIGTVSASLTAVLGGTALVTAMAAFAGGASGGLWNIVQATTEHSAKSLREGPWYYVWTLAQSDRSRS